jgi:DHA1 family tetracycline resistance protein-like MFS transporter
VSSTPRPARAAALAFIFVTVVLDVVAFGITIPVLPRLLEELSAGDTARAAEIYGVFGTAWAAMQLVFAPILGMLSDRFGRRKVLLISCFGLGVDYIFMALAPTVGWLFVGRLISGVTAASFATAAAYVADVTPAEKRAAAFGMVGAGWGLGFVLGPALGGLLGAHDLRLPFWVAAALALANAAYGLFVLPESLPVERRRPLEWRRANPIGALAVLGAHASLYALAVVYFLYALAHHVLPAVFVLYSSNRYGWSERTVGLTLALVGICSVTVQGGLVRPFVRRFGERVGLLTGLSCGALGFTGFALAPSGAWFWAVTPVFALMGLFGPSIQGLMSRRIGPSEQGRLQGVNGSMMGLSGLIGPGLFTQTFAWALREGNGPALSGAPFGLASVFMVVGIAIAAHATRRALDGGGSSTGPTDAVDPAGGPAGPAAADS